MPHELDPPTSHQAPAPVEADRRTVRRVAALGAAAVAVTALATAGVAQSAGASADPAAPTGRIVLGVPGPSASATPTASATPAAPQLRISLAYQRVGRDLTLTIKFAGFVVEPLSTSGAPLTFPTPAKRDIGLGEQLTWGDGTNSDVPGGAKRCPTGNEARTVHEIQDSYTVSKTYTAPGTYTVGYTYAACGLTNGKISGQLTVTVPK
jgi:hypothetical protein